MVENLQEVSKAMKVEDDEGKKQETTLVPKMMKTKSAKFERSPLRCLCSPTTHAGSFRCRFHRAHGGDMVRVGSVGSKLSDFGSKSPMGGKLSEFSMKSPVASKLSEFSKSRTIKEIL